MSPDIRIQYRYQNPVTGRILDVKKAKLSRPDIRRIPVTL